MRTVSSGRNRTVLVLAGLVLLLAGGWLISASTPLVDALPQADPVLPRGDSLVQDIAAAHAAWLVPVGAVLAVLAVIVGIVLLVSQVPSAPTTSTLRITGEDDQVLGSVEPAVLERALGDSVRGVGGVEAASVQMGGGTAAPWLRASVTVAEGAETPLVAAAARRRLIDDATTVLGVAPTRVDLLVRLRSGRAPRTARLDAAPAAT